MDVAQEETMTYIGILVLVIGVGFGALALVLAAKEAFKSKEAATEQTSLLKDLAIVLEQLSKLPTAMAYAVIGIALLAIGCWIIAHGPMQSQPQVPAQQQEKGK